MDKETLKNIIEDGTHGISGDNSQPWKFETSGADLDIFNLPDRDNPILNVRQRGSYVAHGSLIENIVISAKQYGYSASVALFPDTGKNNLTARLIFVKTRAEKAPLSDYIKKRATNRKPYEKRLLNPEHKKELLEAMPPFLGGGDMILDVDWETSTYNYVPWKFEAGTPDVAGAIGLGAAVDYLNNIGMKVIREHEQELTEYVLNKLKQVKNLVTYGPDKIEKRAGVISFNLVKDGKVSIHPHDLASILDAQGIAIRSGHHCAQPLMKVLGIPAAARVSFHLYNNKEEIDQLIPAIEKAKEIFRIK